MGRLSSEKPRRKANFWHFATSEFCHLSESNEPSRVESVESSPVESSESVYRLIIEYSCRNHESLGSFGAAQTLTVKTIPPKGKCRRSTLHLHLSAHKSNKAKTNKPKHHHHQQDKTWSSLKSPRVSQHICMRVQFFDCNTLTIRYIK